MNDDMLSTLRILLRDTKHQIWDDEELTAYLGRSLSFWNLHEPETHVESIAEVEANYPTWQIPILWNSIVHAVVALEFYPQGTSAETLAKYQKLKAEGDRKFDEACEAKARFGKLTSISP